MKTADLSRKNDLILVRGIPGSGKSTMAKLLGAGGSGIRHLEADMFFVHTGNGEYKFDINKLGAAHTWCQEQTRQAMTKGYSRIIVSNTFTTEKEMNPYFQLAKDHNYAVHTIIVENRHGGVNIHNVPDETLQAMRNRFVIKL